MFIRRKGNPTAPCRLLLGGLCALLSPFAASGGEAPKRALTPDQQLLDKALGLHESHRETQALGLYRQVIERFPDSASAFIASQKAAAILHGRDDAAATAEMVGRHCRLFAGMRRSTMKDAQLERVARICSSWGHYTPAVVAGGDLVQRDSSSANRRVELALLFYEMGDLQSAARLAIQATTLPHSSVPYELLFRIYGEAGQTDSRERAFAEGLKRGEQVMKEFPGAAGSYAELARLLALAGRDLPQALTLASRATTLDPSFLYVLGLALARQDRLEDAARTLQRAVDEKRAPDDAVIELSSVYSRLGRQAQAAAVLRPGLERNPYHRGFSAAFQRLTKGGVLETLLAERGPVRLAVLPINNQTNDLDGPAIVRDLAEGRLRRKGYAVLGREEVDSILKSAFGITDAGQLPSVQPSRLGKALQVDGLFYGNLDQFGGINLGFVTQRQVALSFRIVETKSGAERWRGGGIATREGGTFQAKDATANFIVELIHSLSERVRKSPLQFESMEAVRQALSSLPRGTY